MELAKIKEQGIDIAICDPEQYTTALASSRNNLSAAEKEFRELEKRIEIEVASKDDLKLLENAEKQYHYYLSVHEKVEQDDFINRKRFADLTTAGFVEFVKTEQPEAPEGQRAVDSYSVTEGKIVQSWEIITDVEHLKKQVEQLKIELSTSDYKVTKCYEATMLNEPLPYDITALHAQRQALRDEINIIENLISTNNL